MKIWGNLEANLCKCGYVKIYSKVYGHVFALGSSAHGQNVENDNSGCNCECFCARFLVH